MRKKIESEILLEPKNSQITDEDMKDYNRY